MGITVHIYSITTQWHGISQKDTSFPIRYFITYFLNIKIIRFLSDLYFRGTVSLQTYLHISMVYRSSLHLTQQDLPLPFSTHHQFGFSGHQLHGNLSRYYIHRSLWTNLSHIWWHKNIHSNCFEIMTSTKYFAPLTTNLWT